MDQQTFPNQIPIFFLVRVPLASFDVKFSRSQTPNRQTTPSPNPIFFLVTVPQASLDTKFSGPQIP